MFTATTVTSGSSVRPKGAMRMADGARLRLEVAQGDALAFAQEERRAQGEREGLGNHGRRGRAGRAGMQLHHKQPVQGDVHQAGEHRDPHGVVHVPPVADERQAAHLQHQEGRAPRDDRDVVDGFRKGGAASSEQL